MHRSALFALLLAGAAVSQAQEVTVRKAPFSEDTLVGENKQPEWTTRRRFPTTRIYIQQPPGSWGVAQWWRMDDSKGINPRHRFRTEAELGIARHTQLDIYLDNIYTRDETFYYQDVALELRYALADWGKLPLNPTLYYEWKFVDEDQGPDVYEAKLLLGDAIGDWHYGVNLVTEQEVADTRAKEYQVCQALGYTIKDRAWSLGEEFKYVNESEKGSRGESENKLSIGPSVQFRPTVESHLDIVALFGLNDDAPDIETYVVFGYAFGSEGPGGPRAPISAKGE